MINTIKCKGAFFSNIIWFFITFGLLQACTGNTEQSQPLQADEVITVETTDIPDSTDISSWIADIRVIPLKEDTGGSLGEADKIILHGDKYIILDKYVGRSVTVFDRSGTFVISLGSRGRGPKEVVQFNDVWVDPENHIGIYDFASKKILEFGSDYQFIAGRQAQMPLILTSVAPLGSDGFIAYAAYNNDNAPFQGALWQLAVLDADFNIQSTQLPYSDTLQGALVTTPMNAFTKVKDSVRFSKNYDPIIYNIAPSGELSKRYALAYKPEPLPLDFEKEIIQKNIGLFKNPKADRDQVKALFKGYSGYAGSWLETKQYVIFSSFDRDNKPFLSLYSKDKKEILASGGWFFDPGTFDIGFPYPLTTDYDSNRFIAFCSGAYLQMLLTKESPYYELAEQHLEDNFLVEIKLK